MCARKLSDAERCDWLQLISTNHVGPALFWQLMEHFGSARVALDALPGLSRRGGAGRHKVADRGEAKREIENLRRFGARLVAACEPGYPHPLVHIAQAPPLLCMAGKGDVLARPAVAVVGARNASAAGRKLTTTIAGALGEAGLTVVSGLARGIDTAAHTASMETGTIAVLAGGLDVFYPPENEKLQREIAERGLVVSERLLGRPTRGHDFPRRNRLISGLCLGVLVVEAAERSGSLTTAGYAAEQGRSVFAVPGSPLDPRAHGTNALLKDGATITLGADDILALLAPMIDGRTCQPIADDPPDKPGAGMAPLVEMPAFDDIPENAHKRVLQALTTAPLDIDELARACDMSASQIRMAVIELELAGRILRHSGHTISLAP